MVLATYSDYIIFRPFYKFSDEKFNLNFSFLLLPRIRQPFEAKTIQSPLK